jgi:Tol biopolymer transport system component
MTPERYQQVVELCHAAWAQNPKTRPVFLRQACQADEELRQEVEAMLAADEQPGQLLENSPDDIAAQALVARQTRSLIGETLGEYRVIARLGTGGMGDVFLARDLRLGRKAALKLLPEEFSSHPARLRRFEQEAYAVSALNHPNIVTVYGMERQGSIVFLATEFVDGPTLREELTRGPLEIERAVEIALQAARALGVAHATGIIHRDIKPENIILRSDGLVKLLDFGLAKWATNQAGLDELIHLVDSGTTPGLIVGTPQYMSPEQARGVSVDFRTDLFSLGSVLYEMLSGRPAMRGETASDTLAAVLARDPEPLENLRPECPTTIIRIVNRTLDKDRDKRYQSAEEMVADLKVVKGELESGVFVRGGNGSPIAQPAIAVPASSATRSTRARFWLWTLPALTGVLVAVYAVQHKPTSEAGSPSVTPLTTFPGEEVQPSLSPDGNQVAFAFNGGPSSNYDIYTKAIGSEGITRLTSDPADDLDPSWSPDGRNIAFLRYHSDQSARLMVMPSHGGAERQLTKLDLAGIGRETRLAWSPDAEWIAASDEERPLSAARLVLISVGTGRKRKLIYLPHTAEADLSPSFSPDGHRLAYARNISPAVADIYVMEVPHEGGPATETRALTGWNRLTRSPAWSGDGKEIFFVTDARRIGPGVWRMPAFGGGGARRIHQVGEGSESITISPRTNRLVYAKEIHDSNIWRLDLAQVSGAGVSSEPALSRVIASTYGDSQPEYSPDGKHIAFQSDRSGDVEIWIANSDGSSSRQLTRLRAQISGYPRWSPDGKYIVFHSRPSGYANLYIANVQTGSYRALTTGTANNSAPSWSHDGKWIYFVSEPHAETQIWRIPAQGGQASQVTKNGGAIAFDSVDGRFLFYSKFNAPGLWMLPLDGGPESQILPSLYGIDNFAVSKAGIYFARRTAANDGSINFISFSTRDIRELARIHSPLGSGLTVSPDGRSLLFEQADQIGSV